MSDWEGLWAVIPAYNEEETLPSLLSDLNKLEFQGIIVVDDGSVDGTRLKALDTNVHVISHPTNLGVGAAISTGLELAERKGAARVVQIDADGQHLASEIQHLLAHSDADLVIGGRNWERFRISPQKRITVEMIRLLLRFSGVHKIKDPTSGFRLFGPKAISLFSVKMPRDYLGDTIESLILAKKHGLVIEFTEVEMHERKGGNASHSGLRLMGALIAILLRMIVAPIQKESSVD